jgi:hypothetical protein
MTMHGHSFVPKSPRRPGPVAFMHVPKTAGNAITNGLRLTLRPRREVFGWDLSNFGSFRDIDSFSPHVRRHIYAKPSDMRADADFVTGHIARSSIRERYPDIQCMTILREPLSRLMSYWMFQRSHGEPGVAPWGSYAPQQRLARRSLVEFLSTMSIASETDNVLCRKLLWPSPLVPEDEFIAEQDDAAILRKAGETLAGFDFVDVIENGALVDNLTSWFGFPFTLSVANETLSIPQSLRVPLKQELSDAACALMQRRCRLDRVLWENVVASRMPDANADHLRYQSAMRNVARYALLMAA